MTKIEYLSQTEINDIISRPFTEQDVDRANHNLTELPAPRAREVIGEVTDGLGEEVVNVAKIATASVMITAAAASFAAKGSNHKNPENYSRIAASASVAMEKAPVLQKSNKRNLAGEPTTSTSKPLTDKQIIASWKSPLSKQVANYKTVAASLPVSQIPEGISYGDVALVAIAETQAEGGKIKAPDLVQSMDEMNDVDLKGDKITTPIDKTDAEKVVILAGITASVQSKIPEKLAELQQSRQAAADEAAKQQVAQQAQEATPEAYDAKFLMNEVLNHPNIEISDGPGGQVKKSMEDALDDGKTFAHNLGEESNQNIEVNPRLLQFVLYLANQGIKFRIESMTTGNHVLKSWHFAGDAFDVMPDGVLSDQSPEYYNQPEIRAKFQELFAKMYSARQDGAVNELFFAHPPVGTSSLKNGQNMTITGDTWTNHQGHIHVSVTNRDINVGFENSINAAQYSVIQSIPADVATKLRIAQATKDAITAGQIYHVNSAVTLGQWAIESGNGTHCPGNNCFGMKPDGNWHGATQTFRTFEYRNGKRTNEPATFKAYPTQLDSFMDHDRLLATAPHYKDVIAAGSDWRAAVAALVNPGEPAYATAPNYAQAVDQVIESNHFDELTK